MRKSESSLKMIARRDKKFGIIADDLTGAMDTGAGFLGTGLHPLVSFAGKPPAEPSVIIISTDSRDLDPEAAYEKVRRQAHRLAGRQIYKKIDSTLRGNIGKEILAVMDTLKFEKAVVCPAFPANGRIVVDGKLMVGNIPVNETSFAKDPAYGIREASIPALLNEQTGLPIGLIRVEEVEKGPDKVFTQIEKSENKILVVDAITEKNLHSLAQALFMNAGSWLPCGSAGLAKEMPLAFRYKPICDKAFEITVSNKPVLAVVGSRNPASITQMRMAQKLSDFVIICLEPDIVVDRGDNLALTRTLAQEVVEFINSGKSVIITSSLSPYIASLEESTARLLARTVSRIVNKRELSGLFLTGGDIARETCRALGVTNIRILKELEPGVILGEATRKAKQDINIITKAGGFGGENTIVKAVRFLRGGKDE